MYNGQYRVHKKWQKEREAQAAGKQVQIRFFPDGPWKDRDWHFDCCSAEYRIKPEPVVLMGLFIPAVDPQTGLYLFHKPCTKGEENLKLTFDPDTNKLIKAEVINV